MRISCGVSNHRSSSLFPEKRQGPTTRWLAGWQVRHARMESASVSQLPAGDDVVPAKPEIAGSAPISRQPLQQRSPLPSPPPPLTPATIPRVTGQAGLLRVSSSFGAADAGLRAQLGRSVLRSSREPGSGCQTVPGGCRGGAPQEPEDSGRRRCGQGAPSGWGPWARWRS